MEVNQIKKEFFSSRKVKSPLIMVVDDEPNMCNALQRILEKEGYRVIIALDGATALRLVLREIPGVILLDMMMPGMDGREVCTRLRELCDSRIIYFTARAELLKTETRELSEADAFLVKPASTKRILSVVDFMLSGRHQ